MTTERAPGSEIEVVAFFPADHAAVAEGKVYSNGGFWDRLQFPTYPTVVPSLSLVAVLRVPFRHYHADHKIKVAIEDADGNPLPITVEGGFRVGAPPDLQWGDASNLPVAIGLSNVVIMNPGSYVFTLDIDGERLADYRIRAVQVAVPMRLEFGQDHAVGE